MNRKPKRVGKRVVRSERMLMAVGKGPFGFLPWGWGHSRAQVHYAMSHYESAKWERNEYRIVEVEIRLVPRAGKAKKGRKS